MKKRKSNVTGNMDKMLDNFMKHNNGKRTIPKEIIEILKKTASEENTGFSIWQGNKEIYVFHLLTIVMDKDGNIYNLGIDY